MNLKYANIGIYFASGIKITHRTVCSLSFKEIPQEMSEKLQLEILITKL